MPSQAVRASTAQVSVSGTTETRPTELRRAWVQRMRFGVASIVLLATVGVHIGLDVPFHYFAIYLQVVLIPLAIYLLALLVDKRAAKLAPQSLVQLAPAASGTWLREISTPWVLGCVLLADAAWLGAFLIQTGGPTNPFTVLLLLYVTVAAVYLPARWAWGVTVWTCAVFLSLFVLTPEALLHAMHHGPGFYVHLRGMWVSYALAAGTIAYFIARMTRTLEARERALATSTERQEQLAALTTLAAGAAHELGTPLATIAVIASDLREAAATRDDALRDDADLLLGEVARCRTILQSMAGHMPNLPQAGPAQVLLRELGAELVLALPAERRAIVEVRCDAAVSVSAYRDAVHAVLTQLLRNALDAALQVPENGAQAHVSYTPQVILDLRLAGHELVCSVRDNGGGISRELLSNLGKPFFSTKPAGQGLGLGVFLANTVAERIGGHITFTSNSPRGTVASLTVPVP
jgi:two-component system, sensor histidine kinase RegB